MMMLRPRTVLGVTAFVLWGVAANSTAGVRMVPADIESIIVAVLSVR